MIFLTGDFPAHDVWRQDKKHNKASSKAIVDSVTRYFLRGIDIWTGVASGPLQGLKIRRGPPGSTVVGIICPHG